MPRFSVVMLMLASVALAACGRDEITTYRVPKEAPAPMMPMAGTPGMDMSGLAGAGPAASSREIQWKVPAGWKEQTASSMRVGSFLVTGENGQVVDVSVIPLSGEAGGDLSNINRWRGQIKLPPLQDSELAKNVETIHPGGRKMLLVDFVSADPLINNQYRKRITAAMYKSGGRTWFFKMTGEDTAVRATKPQFLEFLSSLKFKSHD